METGSKSEFAKATAACVELALSSVEDDIRKELEASTGAAADALRRVLSKVQERQKVVQPFATDRATAA